MAKLNHHFLKLSPRYFFSEVEQRIAAYKEKNPSHALLDLGIGDITQPLPSTIVSALAEASHEMGHPSAFRGYGPAQGYPFLREAIARHEYEGLAISPDEIFVSDGAQADMANFQELFAVNNKIGVPDPTYPVYLDSNISAGRTRTLLKTGRHGGVVYFPCTEQTEFNPLPPSIGGLDLIYLCSPNNPTGAAINRNLLKGWVDYALANHSVILFDGAYSAFATSSNVPKSIYEIEGAQEAAVEFRTFSKSAGFTGLRCSYTVVPKRLKIKDLGSFHSLHALWKRRHDMKFNGVAYPIQKAAAAVYTPEGQQEVRALVASYLARARLLRNSLSDLGVTVYGGTNSPYLWCQTPSWRKAFYKETLWGFFQDLLESCQIISLPGGGFGHAGEDYVRFSAFAAPAALNEAVSRLRAR